MSSESANAHDAEDCLTDCEHPDHAFDEPVVVNLDWLMFGPVCRESEQYGPVML